MEIHTNNIAFLESELNTSGNYISNEQFVKWLVSRRESVRCEIQLVPFSELKQWHFHSETGNLVHETGKFFSIEGVQVKTNWGSMPQWTQPIINQPEVGFLGIIAKKIAGTLHFLMQAKIEPGNINVVQVSPTLQATKSNYTKVHKGKSPAYLEYFNGSRSVSVLLDQLQSEQGARFHKKRNRNIIIEVFDDIPVYEDFCWLTLGQIKTLMRFDNIINMDTRTVISGISFGSHPKANNDFLYRLIYYNKLFSIHGQEMFHSALNAEDSLFSLEEIISWITELKTKYELEVDRIPLRNITGWTISEDEIFHNQRKYFSVVGADISIANREVAHWFQPLIRSAQEGLAAFIVKKIGGIYHFLVQAKIEAGNFDILELAPTVQCLTGNYRIGLNEYEVPFVNEVLSAPEERIIFKSYQSEEGGRFYQEQNLNIIIEADKDFPIEVPENFLWMTLNQLFTFIKFNNYLNIQARSLLSSILF